METAANKTLEQLQAEAKAAREALAEAERAAALAQREQKEAVEHAERLAKLRAEMDSRKAVISAINKAFEAVFSAVAAEVAKQKLPVDSDLKLVAGEVKFIDERYHETLPSIKGLPRCASVTTVWQTSGTSYYLRASKTEVKIEVGSHYGKTVRFPRKKDGTFNVEKIAQSACEKIAIDMANTKARLDKDQARHASGQIRKKLIKEFGLNDYTSTLDTTQYDGTKVQFNLSVKVTEEEARQLLAAVQALGFCKS